MTRAGDVIEVWDPEVEFDDESDEPRSNHPLLALALVLVAAGITAALLLTAPHPAGYDIAAALARVERTTTRIELDRQAQLGALSSYRDAVRPALERYGASRPRPPSRRPTPGCSR